MTIDTPPSPESERNPDLKGPDLDAVNLDIGDLLEIARHARQYGETGKLVEAYALKMAEQSMLEGDESEAKHAREIPQHFTADLLDRNKLDDLLDKIELYALENKRRRVQNFLIRFKTIFILGVLALIVGFMGYQFFFPKSWRASYFSNDHLSGKPFGTYFERMPEFDWADASPKPGMPNDYFSVRWESDMVLTEDTELVFTTVSDDGVRLYVDSEILINSWVPLDSKMLTAQRSLKAGRYKVKLEYFDQERAAKISLKISSPGGNVPRFEIPS